MPRIKLKVLRTSWGTYDDKTKQIELHKDLKAIPVPSKSFVLNHEKGHLLIDKRKLKIKDEELFCDLFALSKCKINELTSLELLLRKKLIIQYGKLTIKNIIEIIKSL